MDVLSLPGIRQNSTKDRYLFPQSLFGHELTVSDQSWLHSQKARFLQKTQEWSIPQTLIHNSQFLQYLSQSTSSSTLTLSSSSLSYEDKSTQTEDLDPRPQVISYDIPDSFMECMEDFWSSLVTQNTS